MNHRPVINAVVFSLTLALTDAWPRSWQDMVGEDGGGSSDGFGSLLGSAFIVVIGILVSRMAGGMAKKKEQGLYVFLAYGLGAMLLFLPVGAVIEAVGESKGDAFLAAPLLAWLIGKLFPKD